MLKQLFVSALGGLLACVSGCGGDDDSSTSTCVPGDTQSCPCGDGEPDGTQTCQDDGTWEECDCGSSDSDTDTDTASCFYEVSNIFVEFVAAEEATLTKAQATFWVGDDPGGTAIILGSCGEVIAVNDVELEHVTSSPLYEAEIAQAESYEFVFTRPDENPYTSTVADMRPEVTILAPGNDTIPRDQEFDIEWEDNNGGEIHLLIDGDCFWDYPSTLGEVVADNGSHTVPANGIEAFDSGENESCLAEIELSREVDGTLDASLAGTIVGQTIGRSSFTSAPDAS